MSYTALYRKYRPDTFSDVKGQQHVVTTLRNQIRSGRIGHAYLFCGTRGTGKTSAAKIMAKAVNCENPQDGEPCGQCQSCKAIAAGTSMNVIEIDAASNNGVDNIRQIREEVAYSPAEGKYKVYIIDEVHMLSAGAFNALLKTLEEPPSYVIFILATTESHKVPVTILSRCQRYDFHRISQQEIAARLMDLFAREGVEAEEKAVRCIARKADGGMRDALSLADQCISFYLGEKLTFEKVLDVLGTVDTEEQSRLLEEVVEGNVTAVFAHLDEMLYRGRDLSALVSEFTLYCRNVLLYKASEEAEDLLDISEDNIKLLQRDAALISEDTLIRYIRILGELSAMLRNAANQRVQAETAFLRMARPQMQTDRASLLERISLLEEKIAQGVVTVGIPASSTAASDGSAKQQPDQIAKRAYAVPAPEDLQQVMLRWQSIISGVRSPRLQGVLARAKLKFLPEEKDSIVIVFTDFLGETYTKNPGPAVEELEMLIEEKIGRHLRVSLLLSSEEKAQSRQYAAVEIEETARERIHADIEIEDEDDP